MRKNLIAQIKVFYSEETKKVKIFSNLFLKNDTNLILLKSITYNSKVCKSQSEAIKNKTIILIECFDYLTNEFSDYQLICITYNLDLAFEYINQCLNKNFSIGFNTKDNKSNSFELNCIIFNLRNFEFKYTHVLIKKFILDVQKRKIDFLMPTGFYFFNLLINSNISHINLNNYINCNKKLYKININFLFWKKKLFFTYYVILNFFDVLIDRLIKLISKFYFYRRFSETKKNFSLFKRLGEGRDFEVYKASPTKVIKLIKPLGYFSNYFLSKDNNRKRKILISYFSFPELAYPTSLFYSMPYGEKVEELGVKEKKKLIYSFFAAQSYFSRYKLLLWDVGFLYSNFILFRGKYLFCDLTVSALVSNNSELRKLCGKKINEFFIKVNLLCWIIIIFFNKIEVKKIQQLSFYFSNTFAKEIITDLLDIYFKGTSLFELANLIVELDVFSEDSWRNFQKSLLAANISYLERADFNFLRIKNNILHVSGYQEYKINIHSKLFSPIANTKIWPTNAKVHLIEKAMSLINVRKLSYILDLGSNLGAYCFYLTLLLKNVKVVGVDYNPQYTEICNRICGLLNLSPRKIKFVSTEPCFLNKKPDLLLMMGIVHHLFGRTGSFKNMADLLDFLIERTTNFVIIEFPTEFDPKAQKVVRSSDYNLSSFISAVKNNFSIKLIGYTFKTRPVYLLKKIT